MDAARGASHGSAPPVATTSIRYSPVTNAVPTRFTPSVRRTAGISPTDVGSPVTPSSECVSLRNRVSSGLVRARWGLILLVLGLSASGCSASNDGPPVPANMRNPTTSSRPISVAIVQVDVRPFPEGSVVVSRSEPPPGWSSPYYGKRFKDMLAAIGSPLPDPLPQPKRCKRNAENLTVVFTLETGEEISFGPCLRPPAIDRGLSALFAGL